MITSVAILLAFVVVPIQVHGTSTSTTPGPKGQWDKKWESVGGAFPCECKPVTYGELTTERECAAKWRNEPNSQCKDPVDPVTTRPATTGPPTPAPTAFPPGKTNITGNKRIDEFLLGDGDNFNEHVFLTEYEQGKWRPSTIYKWVDFVKAVEKMYTEGVAGMKLYLGNATDGADTEALEGLVNLAAFLAQSMQETIKYDACDENNWSTDTSPQYPISAACGQAGQNYGGGAYDCALACPQDNTMEISAITHANWYGAPGPLFCARDETLINAGKMTAGTNQTGYWNYGGWYPPGGRANLSIPAWEREDGHVYDNQKAGKYQWGPGGSSVEGCCWWGRGIIQTTGRCNFGTLNHYIGKSHKADELPIGYKPLYPDIDFCKDPEIICSSQEHKDLKWIAGFFYWMKSVQLYEKDGWTYMDNLKSFVAGGLTGNAFIDSVSGIVNRGCHDPPCSGSGPVAHGPERRANFDKVLKAMGLRN